MRSRLAMLAATVLVLGWVVAPPAARAAGADAPTRTVASSGPLQVGAAAPSFAGWTLKGDMLSLSKLVAPPREKVADVVVVSFFATWCEPCKKNLPALERVIARSTDRVVRGVLVGYAQGADEIAPFATKYRVSLPVIPDPFAKISERCGVTRALPRTFLVDGKGRVAAIFEHEGSDFEAALARVVAAVPPSAAPR